MTQEICKQISDLLGTVALSELPEDHSGLFSGEYVVYKPQGSNPPKVYRIPADSFAGYLAKHAFMFLMEWPNGQGTPSEDPQRSTVYLNPMGHVGVDDTPVQFARRLLEWRMPGKDSDTIEEKSGSSWTNNVWVGGSKGQNISTKWFKHFQYYYFDDLSNRQRTMLLKYGPAAIKEKTFDIMIWLDASGSMWDEIHDLADSIYDLGRIVFAQNPNNRISIVMFLRGGYWETHDTYASWTKENAVHLPFTSYDNGLGMEKIWTFMHSLADWFENNNGLFDENVWFLNKLAYDNYHFTPRDQEKLEGTDFDTTWSKNGWDVGWRKQENCSCPLTKMIVAISDEIADPYISITGNVAAAYKKGTQFPAQLSVNVQGENWTWNGPTPDKKVDNIDDVLSGNCDWLFIPRSMFYVYRSWDNKPWQYDPYCGKETEPGSDGKWHHQYYPGFCDYTTRWPDIKPPNGYANSGALGKYEDHYGYDPTIHTVEKFFKGFKDNDVQFRFLYTGGESVMKITEFDRREFETCRLYVHRWQEDIISKMYNATKNKQYGFLHLITPTTVGESLMDIFTNEAILGDDSFWSNSMWESHLAPPKTVQQLPWLITKEGQLKKLYLPLTAVVPNLDPDRSVTNPDNFIWSEFKKRNYVKIVTGGWEKDNLHDTRWADPDEGLNDENLGPEVNEDLVVDGVTLQKNMGDIDQTFTTLEQFLDEAIESLVPAEHSGQIIFTASKVNNPLSLNWKNVIPDNAMDGYFVWSGTSSITGENAIKISNIPKHHHNTTFENGNAISISNVSVVGRPEGETVGGIAKTDSAERLPDGSFGRIEDRIQTGLVATSAITNMKGAYCGTVTYSSYKVDADQAPHNNMPLYYKMRAFYHD